MISNERGDVASLSIVPPPPFILPTVHFYQYITPIKKTHSLQPNPTLWRRSIRRFFVSFHVHYYPLFANQPKVHFEIERRRMKTRRRLIAVSYSCKQLGTTRHQQFDTACNSWPHVPLTVYQIITGISVCSEVVRYTKGCYLVLHTDRHRKGGNFHPS